MSVINTNIHINKEYERAVPPLSDEEYSALEESIRTRGLHNPIVINSKGTILDGHNRYSILYKLDLPIDYTIKDFDNEDEEFQYVVESNINRRQLSPFAKIECYEKLIQKFQEKGRQNMLATLRGEKIPFAQGGSAIHFAKTLGMGQRRMQDAFYIMKHGNSQLKRQLRENKITINAAKQLLTKSDRVVRKNLKYNKKEVQCPKCFHKMFRDELIKT